MNVIVHIGLCVSDLARAERFFAEGLGFVPDRALSMSATQIGPLMQIEPPSDLKAVYLRLGNQTLELIAFTPEATVTAGSRAFNQTGLTHLSIAVEDVAATLARCNALGGNIVAHVGRAAVLRDPDGQLIELLEFAVHEEIERDRTERAKSASPR